MVRIGILVHGRHVETEGWERIVWGEAPRKLGSLPMMVLVALHRGIEHVGKIVVGTGASVRDGVVEAECMKRFLLANRASLEAFDRIREHPDFEPARRDGTLDRLLEGIVCETTSRNTVEEIAAAAAIFATAGIREVIHVTCASHAPRCLRDSAVAAEQGRIPGDQVWSVVRDQTTYAGTSAADVAVFEPPHRGDDPMTRSPMKPHEVFPRFYRIRGFEAKVRTLSAIDALITQSASEE